nr:CD36 family protein [Candidatus Poseidoniales archaeon]
MTRTSAYTMIVSSLVLLVLNLAIIAPMATSAVQDVVDEMTVMTEEDWSDDSWLNSTDERSYYAWTIANIDDVKNGSESQFERVGPYTFQIDSERNIIEHDAINGTLTYDEISTFTSIGENSPTDLISNINILYEAQKIVVFPTLIEQLQQISQAGFVVGMLEYDLTYTHASIRIAEDLQDDFDSTELDSSNGSAAVGNSIIETWATAENYSGPEANFTDLSTAFWGVVAPGTTDEDLSLLSKHGSEYFLGFGSPSQTNSSPRAAVFGYADSDSQITEARDSALHTYVQNAWD